MRKQVLRSSTLALLSGVILALLLLASGCSAGGRGAVLTGTPADLDNNARYVFYLHGRIVEDGGRQPTDPRFGVYEYDAILASLANGGLQVISEARPPNTDPYKYAVALAGQVQDLIDARIPPSHITVVGVSKGGGIALITSAILMNDELQFVFLASCGEEVLENTGLRIAGRALSIYEASDEIAFSCQPLFDRSSPRSEFEEIRLDTGLAHGAFYTPRSEWLDPTVKWALSGADLAGPSH